MSFAREAVGQVCGTNASVVCRSLYDWTGNARLTEVVEGFHVFSVLLILVIAFVANRVLRQLIRRTLVRIAAKPGGATPGSMTHRPRQQQRIDALSTVLQSVSSVIIAALATFLVLDRFGVNLAPLLAGAGVIGIAIGFGAQSLVRDLLAGMLILIEDQYGVGDIITLDQEVSGTVEAISLRITRLRAVDGTMWHVPNSQIGRVGNQSQHWSRALLDIEVAYDTPLQHAQEVIKSVADRVAATEPDILEEPRVWGVESLSASGVVIRLVVKTTPSAQWQISRQLREAIKEEFDDVGIEIPFPQQTTWIRHEAGADAEAPVR